MDSGAVRLSTVPVGQKIMHQYLKIADNLDIEQYNIIYCDKWVTIYCDLNLISAQACSTDLQAVYTFVLLQVLRHMYQAIMTGSGSEIEAKYGLDEH